MLRKIVFRSFLGFRFWLYLSLCYHVATRRTNQDKLLSPNPLPVLNWIVIEWNLGTKKKSRWRLWDWLDIYLWICLKLQDCIGLLGYNVQFKCDKVGCKENVILSTKKEFRDVGSNAAPWEVCWFVATLSTFWRHKL